MSRGARRWRWAAVAAAVLLGTPFAAHLGIQRLARMRPAPVALAPMPVVEAAGGVRRNGAAYVRHRGEILEVRLVGSPVEIGAAHARLLRDEMIENEGILFARFREMVPSRLARALLLDVAQWRYLGLDASLADARRQELAGMAAGFGPDPFADWFPTYQRHVYLDAVYDAALAFEGSPLVGCTTFVLHGTATQDGDSLLARAFDFEVDPVFDRGKAVFLVLEDGQIPFASVSWPGLVGVTSGMNAAGVAVVVHGGRAGRTLARGEPVLHALRRVLGTARTTEEAVAALGDRTPMVSHIVIVTDAAGTAVAVERVPGEAPFVRPLGERSAVTNHLEGPAAGDPKNQRVRRTTTTLARRARADELLAHLPANANVPDAVSLLRDRDGVGDTRLPLGDRRAIDALIATHGVVMNATRRVLWVSEGPHLIGRFIAFDLGRLLADGFDPADDRRPPPTLPPADLLTSGAYARWVAGPDGHP